MFKAFPIVALAALISACAGQYKIPETAATATITLMHTMAVFPSTTTLNAFDNAECQQNDHSGQLAKIGNDTMISAKKATVTIQAGKPIYLATHLWKESGSERYGYLIFDCSKLIAFTPESGKHYILKAKAVKNMQCSVELTEQSSQLPPLDLSEHKNRAACKKTGMLDI